MRSRNVYFLEPGRAEIREEQVPDPAADQVQVRCIANGICMAEVSLFTGASPSTFPRKVGHEGIGVVTKAGKDVGHLQEGDFVDCWQWDTVQNVNANRVHKFAVPPGDPALYLAEPVACVVNALYAYDITPGDRVLVMGVGFMGLLNVQGLARYPLAELVATDVKPENLKLAAEFGATEVIEAGTLRGLQRMDELESHPFDLVVEAAGVAETVQMAGTLTRLGGRLAIFAWHHAPRSVDLGVWHIRGLKVLNTAPNIGRDRTIDSRGRAVTLLDRGIFDLTELVTHRHLVSEVQEAMELAAERPSDYIKGVLSFDDRT